MKAGAMIATRIARRPAGDDFPPIDDRSPYHRHVLVGGNTWVPAMIRDFADELAALTLQIGTFIGAEVVVVEDWIVEQYAREPMADA